MARKRKKQKNQLPKGLSARDRRYRLLYGITIQQYDRAFEAQGKVCAICQRSPKPGKNLHVDHDHKPPYRVRGLLDFRCNRIVLGRGREEPQIHRAAADYLESSFDIRTL